MVTGDTHVMTFEEFQATGRDVADLGAIEHIAASGATGPGRVYMDELFMYQPAPLGWCVPIGSHEGLFGDVVSAERALYEFAVSEGYIS
jgi:hypothetical protein